MITKIILIGTGCALVGGMGTYIACHEVTPTKALEVEAVKSVEVRYVPAPAPVNVSVSSPPVNVSNNTSVNNYNTNNNSNANNINNTNNTTPASQTHPCPNSYNGHSSGLSIGLDVDLDVNALVAVR